MAIITIAVKEDFEKIVKSIPRHAYMAVTDKATYIWLVPKVTSRHRHYYVYSTRIEKEIDELLTMIKTLGITIIEGSVTFRSE